MRCWAVTNYILAPLSYILASLIMFKAVVAPTAEGQGLSFLPSHIRLMFPLSFHLEYLIVLLHLNAIKPSTQLPVTVKG